MFWWRMHVEVASVFLVYAPLFDSLFLLILRLLWRPRLLLQVQPCIRAPLRYIRANVLPVGTVGWQRQCHATSQVTSSMLMRDARC